MKSFNVFLVLFTVADLALCNTYYVSPDGNNWGPGTFDAPWQTIQKATNTLVAGDTALIREGVYYEGAGFNNSGTAEDKIVLMAYENENVVMDGNNISEVILYVPRNHIEIYNIKFRNGNSWGILLLDCNHVRIENCNIQENEKSAIRIITSSNIELVNNTLKNTARDEDWGGGIWASAVNNIEIKGNHISNTTAIAFGVLIDYSNHIIVENNYTYDTMHCGVNVLHSHDININDNEIVLACNGGFGECLSVGDSYDFLVYNNEVHTSGDVTYGGEGILAGGGSYDGKVYDNYVHDLEKVSIYVCEGDQATHDIEVFSNIVDNCNNGIAVGSEGGGPVENISIYRNIVFNVLGIGINVAPWVEDGLRKKIKIYNNTFYKNGGGILVETSNIENISVLNNICSQNAAFQLEITHDEAIENVTVEYNIIDGKQVHDISVYSDNNIFDDPVFVDASNMDFHLTENSPAIDAGHPDSQYNDPDGTRNDIGAFYYQASIVEHSDNRCLPASFILSQNYPNPFNGSTIISYSLKRSNFVKLKVYDVLGREVQTLVDKFQDANSYSIHYNGTGLTSGIYYYKLQAGNDFGESRKMLLIR